MLHVEVVGNVTQTILGTYIYARMRHVAYDVARARAKIETTKVRNELKLRQKQ